MRISVVIFGELFTCRHNIFKNTNNLNDLNENKMKLSQLPFPEIAKLKVVCVYKSLTYKKAFFMLCQCTQTTFLALLHCEFII